LFAIKKAMKKEKPEALLEALREFVACFQQWPAEEKQYLCNASTWFNQQRWLDDRTTWRKGKQSTATRSNAF